MSNEEHRNSLADQAAAWIPPWERPAPPRATPAEPSDQPTEPSDQPTEASAPVAGQDPGGTGPTETGLTATSLNEARPTDTEASDPASTGDTDGGAADSAPTGGTDGPAGEGAAAGVPKKPPAPRRRVTPAPEPAPVLDDAELRGALEAILLVVDEPVSELTLAQVLEQPAERVGPMLDEIAAGYTAAGHGFELRRAAGGWRLYTRPEYATYVERFVLDGQSVRLTQAALETLAVIAYKQPVTRSRISAIRGVNCDGVIRTLVSRGLVEECGTEPDSGAFLYRTTTMFLEKLGLNSVADLPPLAPFLPDDVEELADATR
ncbi:SMC-Scp complex subunit ScpB [Micromonospora sp. NPDC050200]|uniref:SMC-Scp complex subunit ScpB n=1 Tax=Micromonospora sp. NPDC050200 TaxID=3155664 RepID=UPI0033DDCDE3